MKQKQKLQISYYDLEKVMTWPNTPGIESFNRAMEAHDQLYQAEPSTHKQLEMEDFILAEQFDLHLNTEKFRHYAVEKFTQMLPDHSKDMQIPLTIRIAMEGTSQDTIGMVTIKRKPDGYGSYIFTQLLKHPSWMGVDASLPSLQGLRAVVFQSYIKDQPSVVLAMDPNTLQANSAAPFPSGHSSILRDMLAWHGAEPVWTDVTLG